MGICYKFRPSEIKFRQNEIFYKKKEADGGLEYKQNLKA